MLPGILKLMKEGGPNIGLRTLHNFSKNFHFPDWWHAHSMLVPGRSVVRYAYDSLHNSIRSAAVGLGNAERHDRLRYRANVSQCGFTIIEVMIVLAVSGMMFLAAVILINGRQNKAEFTTGIYSLQQQLQQAVNDTTDGFYPNNGGFTCNGDSSPVTFSSTSQKDTQGANGGCIFMGNALQFGLGSGGAAASSIGILPLVGNQYNPPGSTIPTLTVSAAAPRAVYPGSSERQVPTNTVSVQYMENGLTVAKANTEGCSGVNSGICYTESGNATIEATGIVAFVTGNSDGTITSFGSSGNYSLKAGSQQLSLYGVSGGSVPSQPNQSLSAASDSIGNTLNGGASNLHPAASASICIASATTNQSGLFTISSGLRVTLAIKSGLTC